MKHVIRKPYWNYEKEEKWLNDMSARGLALSDYSWCRYVFEEALKGEYIYRIELLEHRAAHPESQNYIRFLEEAGVEFVTSYMRWAYFRKKAADGPFDLYSDIDSKIAHYKKVFTFWLTLGIAELAIVLSNVSLGIKHWGNSALNMVLGVFLTVVGVLLLTVALPLRKKIKQLKKEKRIRES
jgi:hypothetical protein